MKINNLDKQYINLLKTILKEGVDKSDRTGTGTRSVFGEQIKHDMNDGFPLLTSKKMAWKQIVTELLWMLRGETNIRPLVEQGNYIWVGDAFKNFQSHKAAYLKNGEPTYALLAERSKWFDKIETKLDFIKYIIDDDQFARIWGELGPIYGRQWRGELTMSPRGYDQETFLPIGYREYRRNDQLADAINMLKTNPDSRRIIVDSWNVNELNTMVLPPCHKSYQFYTRELSNFDRILIYNLNAEEPIETSLMRIELNDGIEETIVKLLDGANIPKRAISIRWEQRSVDTPLGLPFNIASYGLLLEIVGKLVNMVPDKLIGHLGDTHIYLNQMDGVNVQIKRMGHELPTLKHVKTDDFYSRASEELSILHQLNWTDFELLNYKHDDTIVYPLSN